jgi:hypothetical protein
MTVADCAGASLAFAIAHGVIVTKNMSSATATPTPFRNVVLIIFNRLTPFVPL